MGVELCLLHLSLVGVPVEAIISHSDGFSLKKPSGDPRGMTLWPQGKAREGEAVSEANVGRGKSFPYPRRP